jgi:cardiolipin synthase
VENGVAVHVMLSEHSTQEKYELASRYGILDLLDAGVTVHMYDSPEGAFLHLKLMVADRSLVSIGSANYNFRSQTLSREMGLVYDDGAVAEDAMSLIEELLSHSRIVTREEAIEYRTLAGLWNYLLMQVWG